MSNYEWKDALEEICSLDFDVRLNVVSSLDSLMAVLPNEGSVICLLVACGNSDQDPDLLMSESVGTVLSKMYSLASEQINNDYENSYDMALTVLGFVLLTTNPDLALTVLNILDSVQHGWYTKQLAKKIKSNDV